MNIKAVVLQKLVTKITDEFTVIKKDKTWFLDFIYILRVFDKQY